MKSFLQVAVHHFAQLCVHKANTLVQEYQMPMDVQHLTHACRQQMEMMEMHVQLHVL